MAVASIQLDRAGRRALLALAIALAWHLAVGLAIQLWRGPAPKEARPSVKLAPIAGPIKEQVLADRARRQSKKPPPVEPPRPVGPVVALPPPPSREVPKDPKFAAEHDHYAKQERKSRAARLQPGHLARLEAGRQRTRSAGANSSRSGQTDKPPGRSAASGQQARLRAAQDGLELRLAPPVGPRGRAISKEQDEAQPLARARGGGPRRALTLGDLLPSAATLARIDQAPMADVLAPSLDEGEERMLNARAFRFASFFNRLKERIAGHWRPLEAIAAQDAAGGLSILQERVTVLAVTLDAEGNVVTMQIEQSAGVPQLDEAAKTAFLRGQPYSHPPRALLSSAGLLRFSFAFAVTPASSGGAFLPPP